MKKTIAMLLALAMTLSLCACGGGGSKSTPSTGTTSAGSAASASTAETDPADDFYLDIKFSNVFQPTEWNYKASEKLAEMITERTEGHINVTYYGQNELDCYGDSVTQAVNGANWMGLEEPSLFADYVGDAAVLIGPMLYNSNDEYNYVMESDIVKDVIDRLAAENIHILDTHYSFGFRSVVTNRDIYTPADLTGVKLRATSSAMFSKTVECLGAIPTPMSFTECLSAISSGVVEGFEGSTSTLAGAGAPYELVKKVALTNHLIATRWLFMPEDLYQSIPEKWRNIIDECAVECGIWEQTSCAEDEDTQKKMLAENGVTWNEVDLDAFTEACAPVYDWMVEEYGANPELRDQLVALINDYRASNK
ncbi:TRAP transporter substrate-binding protein DctP [Pseudoflavonifractor phocaeensis]|uniref:TRAP transporter substrate-binding protein DctP n=1 Tax=Pseudoflavonifractor phocaeensis TaxID=1870988 RepID=UPI001F2EE901|nr:TRAP transporter substrate-binding protein DctP [Pseudoflavonifractor phocaeensis]MCF2661358.1 TRAP transporter substrate-binding protein DctP [Pseudoflavonifractor phocaeensis]